MLRSITATALKREFQVTSAFVTVNPGETAPLTARCPTGSSLLSGGYNLKSGDLASGGYIEGDKPLAFSWVVILNNAHGTKPITLRSEALCV